MNTQYPIWQAPDAFLYVYSDLTQFICEINAGIMGETFLSVGYSYPNFADLSRIRGDGLQKICATLETYWTSENRLKSLPEMLPIMYEIVQLVNNVFNTVI